MAEDSNQLISIHTFAKGMNQDNDPQLHPEDAYRSALNAVVTNTQGGTFSLTYERGNKPITNLPDEAQVIGQSTLDSEIILFLVTADGNSEIGIVSSNNSYTTIAPSTPSNVLNLSLSYPIDCVSRRKLTGERVVYWTDNNNPIGFLNIDDQLDPTTAISDADLGKATQLIPSTLVPTIQVNRILETGSLPVNMYQIGIRYKDSNFTPTQIVSLSSLVPIVDELESSGDANYDGEELNIATTKAIEFTLTGVDVSYPYVDLVLFYFEDDVNSPIAKLINTYETSETMTLVASSLEGDTTEDFNSQELLIPRVSYDRAKAIEQKDDHLFLANLSDSSVDNYQDFQSIASFITTNYFIEELPYTPYKPLTNGEIEEDLSGTLPLEITSIETVNSYEDVFYNPPGPSTEPTPDTVTITIKFSKNIQPVTLKDIALFLGDINTPSVIHITPNGIIDNVFDEVGSVPIPMTLTSLADGFSIKVQYNIDVNALDTTNPAITSDDYTVRNGYVTGFSTADSKNYLKLQVTSVDGDFYQSSISGNQRVIYFTPPDGQPQTLVNSGLQGYKNPLNTYNKMGYRRDEIYSFAIRFIKRNGESTPDFHIPGQHLIDTPAVPTTPGVIANNTTGTLGTYISSLEYPSNQGYPIGFIRHHKMPTLQQEPHFRNEGDAVFIRVLGVEFQNIIIPPDVQDKIQGYVITRERRNTPENRSILSSGIFSHLAQVPSGIADISNDGPGAETVVHRPLVDDSPAPQIGSTHLIKTPCANKLTIDIEELEVAGLIIGDRKRALVRTSLRGYFKNIIAFNSPDYDLVDSAFFDLSEASLLRDEFKIIADDTNDVKTSSSGTLTAYNEVVPSPKAGARDLPHGTTFLDFNKLFVADSTEVTNYVPTTFSILEKDQALVNSVKVYPDISTTNIRNTDGAAGFDKYVLLKLSADLPDDYTDGELTFKIPDSLWDQDFTNRFKYSGYFRPIFSDIKHKYLTLYKTNTSQYGQVYSSEYIPICQIATGTSISCFGGDTFISKYYLGEKAIIPARGVQAQKFPNGAPLSFSLQFSYPSANSNNTNGFPEGGIDIRSITGFFVESNINTEYRHTYRDPVDNTAVQIPYFPKNRDYIQVAKFSLNSSAYNTVFSAENTNARGFTRPQSNDAIVSDFITRIIYSLPGTFDAIVDNYRIFLQENYHDVPSNKGEIWDLFVQNNILYAHTPRSLWRTSVNERSVISPNNETPESVYLGNGGLFPIPSREMLTSQGGYGGSISQWGGINTPFGYFFVDKLQGKVFYLTDSLTDITSGLTRFFNSTALRDTSNLVDNPFIKSGVVSGYDSDNNRVLFTDTSNNLANGGFTVSYFPAAKSWVSFHSYRPKTYIQLDNKFITVDNDILNNKDNLFRHHIKEDPLILPGTFYNSKFPFEIVIISNKNPLLTKTFDNMIAYIYASNGDVKEFFESGEFKTSTKQTSGVINFLLSKLRGAYQRVALVNDEFRFAVPRENNFQQSRLKGKYLESRLSYNGDEELVLNLLTTKFRINHR